MAEELTWLPAWQIRDLVKKGDVSPVEVTDHFLGRIEELDGQLGTFAHIDAEGARSQATAAERAVRQGDELGSLHGIPVSVKEHIAVEGLPCYQIYPKAEGEPGGFGERPIATRDSAAVERLRRAGAILIGTNVIGGDARNPWDPTRTPGFSSSGPAAASSARLVPIAIGSDGGGSTRLPAAYCGVVGVHTTAGLVPELTHGRPRVPVITGSTGPLCRDVVDAAVALQAMAGPDGRDYFCHLGEPDNYLASIDSGVEGMRFAWTDDFGFAGAYAQDESPRVIATVRDAAAGLASVGAVVEPIDVVWEDFFSGFMASTYIFQFGPMQRPQPTAEDWDESLEVRGRNWDRFMAVLDRHEVLLSPTSQIIAWTVEDFMGAWADGSRFHNGTFGPGTYTSHTHMFNWLGLPAFTVPCGFVDGMPVGLQLIGKPGGEASLFRVANAFQQAFPQAGHPTVS